MQCAACGYILDPFDRACPKCAALARTRQPAVPPATVVMPAGTVPGFAGESCKVCPACGQPAVLSMDICRRCGYRYAWPLDAAALPVAVAASGFTSVAEYEAAVREAAERRERRQIGWIAGVSLALLLVGVMAGFVLTSRPNRSAAGSVAVQSGRSGGGGMFGAVNSDQMSSRLATASATTGGDLEISLAWNTLSDIDLQVSDPAGEEIAADHPRSASGGVQDVDANPTLLTSAGEMRAMMGQVPGRENILPLPELLVDLDEKTGRPDPFAGLEPASNGGKARGHWTHQPIEHIYFARAPKGTYTVRAHCYSWREPDQRPLPYTVEVRSHNRVVYRTDGLIGPASYAADGAPAIEVCRFENK